MGVRGVLAAAAAAVVVALMAATPALADWTTYHNDNSHTGDAASATPVAGSGIAWSSPNLAGDITAEPLYFNGVLYVATMQNYLYALDPTNGSILWADHLDTPYDTGANPLPCGNDFAFIGIMGTPVIDAATNTLYAVGMTSDGTYHFWAIDLTTHGTRYAPVIISATGFDPAIHNQRGALTFYNGQVFVPFGGRDGDCGNYHGWVFRLDASTGGGMLSYHTTASGAGMWGRGGGVIVNGFYTIATGNAVGSDQCTSTFKEQNAVVKLYTDLTLYQYWAPTDYSSLSCSDTDIGSTGPSLVNGGANIVQSGKNGQVYVLNAANLGGIGGEVGTAGGVSCSGASFGGNGYDPSNGWVFLPCGGNLDAFSLSGTTLTSQWSAGITAGAPIVLGGSVWAIDRGGGGLTVFAESNGGTLFHDGTLGAVDHGFVSPAYGGGLVYAAGNSGGPFIRAYFAGGWSASYNLSAAPTSWVANQSQTFNVTVMNSGTQPWPHTGSNPVELDLHFTTHTGGAAQENNWLTSQVFPLTADIAPGGSQTLSVTATAPSQSGSISLEATMFKNQQFWFQQSSAVAVTVGPATWAASYSFTPPATWVQGQTQSVSVTLNNIGNQTWPHSGANPVELDMHFTTQPGGSSKMNSWSTSQIFALPNDVAPAGSVTFSVNVTAPASASGSMSLEATLFKNQQFWFNQFSAQPVTVNAHWQGSVDLSAAPTSWVANQSQSFSVTITNQGDQTWPNTGPNPVELDIHFSTMNGSNAQISCCWKTSQIIPLPSSVAPGGTTTFTVNVFGPPGGGSFFLQAQLFKNQQFWFPTWNTVSTTVAAPTWTVAYTFAPPTTWTAGQTQSVSITLNNAGNQTWVNTGANPVELDIHFSTMNGGNSQISCCWKTSQIIGLPSTVAPGGSVTFTIQVTAPTAAGSYFLEAQLFKNQQFWFSTWSATGVTVS